MCVYFCVSVCVTSNESVLGHERKNIMDSVNHQLFAIPIDSWLNGVDCGLLEYILTKSGYCTAGENLM